MGLFPEFSAFFIGYGSYHSNPVNKIIHLICIPLILSSALGMLSHTNFAVENPLTSCELFKLNIPFFVVLLLSFAYVNVELATGMISTALYLGHWVLNNYLFDLAVKTNQIDFHFKVALTLHIITWVLQFIGHGFFEKRAPALLDNLLYTLVAPNFVTIEIMFDLGYKPEVFEQCKEQIEKNVAAFKIKREEAKQKKSKKTQ